MKKISFMAEIDSTKAAKQLDALMRKIAKTTESLNTATARRSSIEEQMDAAAAKADETREKVKALKDELATATARVESSKIGGTPTLATYDAQAVQSRIQAQLKAQEEILKSQEREVDGLGKQWAKADAQVANLSNTLTQQQAAAGNLEKELGKAFDPKKIQEAGEAVRSKLAGGFKTVLKYVLGIRSLYILVRMMRTAITEGIKEMTKYDSGVNKTVSNLKNSLTGLKASLASAFAPLLQAIAPILTKIINLCATVINYIGMLFAALNGATSYKKAIATQTDYAKSLQATGAAAKQAAGYLGGLDEIQRYDSGDSGGGGGGAAAGMMEGLEEVEIPQGIQKTMGWVREHLDDIKEAAVAVGLAIAAWKIGKAFGLDLSDTFGLALMVAGAFETVQSYIDMWTHGISDKGLIKFLGAVAALAVGLGVVFSPVAAGIALVVAGIALLVLVVHEHWDDIKEYLAETWENIKGGLKAALDWIVDLWTTVWTAIKEFFVNLWTGLIATYKWIWEVIKTVVKIAINAIRTTIITLFTAIKDKIVSIWTAIKTALQALWDAITAAAGNAWNALKNAVVTIVSDLKTRITDTVNNLRTALSNAWSTISTATTTVWQAISTSATNIWTGLKNSIVSVVESLRTRVTGIADGIRNAMASAWAAVRNSATTAWEAVKNAILRPIEAAKSKIAGIVDAIRSMFSNLHISIPHIKMPHISVDWQSTGWLGQKFGISSIPHLSVQWYAKGGIVDRASLIGAGEAGKEAIVPLERHTEWIDLVADRLADILADRLETIMLRLPLPAVATGSVIPPRLTVEVPGLADLRTDIARLTDTLKEQRSAGNGNYRFVAQVNRRTLFDETIAEARLRQSATGKNPFDL